MRKHFYILIFTITIFILMIIVPQKIYTLDKEIEMMKNLQEEYTQVTKGKRKFVPKDIENATRETTLEDVQKMLEEMTGPQITKEESLEKGIGFDEH